MLSSLAKLAEKLKQEKLDVSKIRRQSQRQLDNALSLSRHSLSGLRSLEKHLEQSKDRLSEINTDLNQISSRKESLERLVKAAQDRLSQEITIKDKAQIDLANAETDEAKQEAQYRLTISTEKIQELESEISLREKAIVKISQEIDNCKKLQSGISTKIQKQIKSKPLLVTQLKTSKADSELLKKKLDYATKREQSVNTTLANVSARLEKMLAKKPKSAKSTAKSKNKIKSSKKIKRVKSKKKTSR